jgi:Helix-turn-helix domain
VTNPILSVSKAAELSGMDRRTITRYAEQGRFPNAERTHGREGPGTGPWRIPPGDLIATGCRSAHQRSSRSTPASWRLCGPQV